MSSFNPNRRDAVRAAALAGLVLILAGCGFRPLYGTRAESTTSADLASVRIDLIADRIGQQLRNNLLDRINPHGEPRRPRYNLAVRVRESRQSLAIRQDATATRANLIVRASFALKQPGVKKPVFSGSSGSTNSFNITTSNFATVAAEADARERALRVIGDDIATRLAIYFNSQAAAK